MPTQAYPYIAITDGTTTVVFSDGANGAVNYPIERGRWAPQIPPLRMGQLGGRTVYDDVVEELEIYVTGASASAAMANLATLNGLLDQAERFTRFGENVAPVLFQYAPQGSTIASTAAPYQAMILGRAPDDTTRSPIDLPDTFTDVGMTQKVLGVRVRFWRRGQLVSTDVSNTSSSGSNPAKLTATLGSSATASSPMKVDLNGFATTTTPTLPNSYLIIAPATSYVSIFDASLMTVGADAGYATSAEAAKKPYNGTNVLRYTATTTTAKNTGSLADVSFTNGKRVQVLVVVRNNTFGSVPTTTFQIRANIASDAGTVSTPYQPVEASNQFPQIVNLGVAVVASAMTGVSLTIISSNGSGSPTIDISHIVVVNVDNERSRVIPIDGKTVSLSAGAFTLTLDDQILTGEAPIAKAAGASSTFNLLGYHTDIMLATTGTTVTAIWLATGGFSSDRWRFTNSSDTILTNTLAVTRHTSYLVPQ